jgi:hypothetical protein
MHDMQCCLYEHYSERAVWSKHDKQQYFVDRACSARKLRRFDCAVIHLELWRRRGFVSCVLQRYQSSSFGIGNALVDKCGGRNSRSICYFCYKHGGKQRLV